MKKKILTILFSTFLLGILIFQGGCVKEDFDTVPNIKDTSNLVSTLSIAELKALTNLAAVTKVKDLISPSLWQTIKSRNLAKGVADTASVVIEGYVTTSDSTGNFYEVFTMQDATGGIDIKINASDLHSIYRLKPGQKVMVKVKDLYLGNYRGTFQVGAGIVELGVYKIVGIPSTLVYNYIERTGRRIKLIPDTLTISEINDSYIQKLVCIKDVQFKDPYNKFSILGENSNRTLVDCSGNMLILRTSGFSTFADSVVPSLKGTITGMLGTFDATKQLFIRNLKDINFTLPRCGVTPPTPNTTIAALKAMCTSSFLNITGNIVIEGTVSANDQSGNLFKQLNIQDATGGITFSINISGLYPEYPVGTKLAINCDGLCIGKYGNVVQLGMPPYSSYVTRVDPAVFYSKVFTIGSNETITPIKTTIGGFSNDLVNKLITIEDVQFTSTELGKAWADPTATANRYIEDLFGSKTIVRTSNYANFANTILPSYRGTITALLTKYNSDYQLIIRDLGDIRMIKPRFNFILSQDFNSVSLGSPIEIGGWKNIVSAGTRNWLGMSSSINGTTHYYAEINPNNSGEANNVAWLVSPQVNLAGIASKTLFFQTAFNNWAGNGTLEAFISTNFNGTDVAAATWTPIQGVHIAQQADGATNWVNSGNIDLSQYNSNIYIGFKYTSAGGNSATAFRVDNVKIY